MLTKQTIEKKKDGDQNFIEYLKKNILEIYKKLIDDENLSGIPLN